MDIKELTIKEANNRIDEIDNKLEYYLNKKELEFNKTQPKATDIKTDITTGGARTDKNIQYMIICEQYDPIIESLQNEKQVLLDFVEKELKRINKYGDVEQQIIYYKEQYIPRYHDEVTWYFISRKVHASESTCRRIYKKYKKSRFIES